MGLDFPKNPPGPGTRDGDEVTTAPAKNDRSLLGAERGTDHTRRLETDANRNLYVNVAADSKSETLLYSDTISALAASTPTAFVAYTVPSDQQITRVALWGQGAADYTLRLNGGTIGQKGTNLELNTEFVFGSGYPVATADSVDVVVDHCSTGHTKDFKLYIYGA